jgi:hypothetical protein
MYAINIIWYVCGRACSIRVSLCFVSFLSLLVSRLPSTCLLASLPLSLPLSLSLSLYLFVFI